MSTSINTGSVPYGPETSTDTPAGEAEAASTVASVTQGTSNGGAPGLQVSYVQAVIMDIVAVLLFALFARIAHNSPELPFTWGGVVATAWPFVLGAAAGFGGMAILHKPAGTVKPFGMTVWILAVVVGLTIWGIHHNTFPHWSFMIVATVVSALFILGWRGLTRFSASRTRKRRERRQALIDAEEVSKYTSR